METLLTKANSLAGGLKGLLLGLAGLFIVAQIVFGPQIGLDIVTNLSNLIGSFIGSGASLVSIITGVIVLGLLTD